MTLAFGRDKFERRNVSLTEGVAEVLMKENDFFCFCFFIRFYYRVPLWYRLVNYFRKLFIEK